MVGWGRRSGQPQTTRVHTSVATTGPAGDQLLRTSVCSHRRQRVQYRAHAGMSTFTGASSTPRLPAETPSDLTAGPRLTPLPDSGHKELQRSGASPTVARDTAAGRPSSRCRLWHGRGAGRAPRWCVTPPAGRPSGCCWPWRGQRAAVNFMNFDVSTRVRRKK